MDWQKLLGGPIFSADAVPRQLGAPQVFNGTIISTYFDRGYCDQDMECPMNCEIANAAAMRMATVIREFDVLQRLMAHGTVLRCSVRHGLLHFEFSDIVVPICVIHRIMKTFLLSLEKKPLRVRLSPEDGWHTAAFSGIAIAFC